VAADVKIDTALPLLDLNDDAGIARFVLRYLELQ
jgi:hypothetical protein